MKPAKTPKGVPITVEVTAEHIDVGTAECRAALEGEPIRVVERSPLHHALRPHLGGRAFKVFPYSVLFYDEAGGPLSVNLPPEAVVFVDACDEHLYHGGGTPAPATVVLYLPAEVLP